MIVVAVVVVVEELVWTSSMTATTMMEGLRNFTLTMPLRHRVSEGNEFIEEATDPTVIKSRISVRETPL